MTRLAHPHWPRIAYTALALGFVVGCSKDKPSPPEDGARAVGTADGPSVGSAASPGAAASGAASSATAPSAGSQSGPGAAPKPPRPGLAGCPSPDHLVAVIAADRYLPSFGDKRLVLEQMLVGQSPIGIEGEPHAEPISPALEKSLGLAAGSVVLFADEDRKACTLASGSSWLIHGEAPWEQQPVAATDWTGDCDVGAPKSVDYSYGRLGFRIAGHKKRTLNPSDVDCRLQLPGPIAEPLVQSTDSEPDIRKGFDPNACAPPLCELLHDTKGFALADRRLELSRATHVMERNEDPCQWTKRDYLRVVYQEGGRQGTVEAVGLDQVLVSGGRIVGFLDGTTTGVDVWYWPPNEAPFLAQSLITRWAHEEDAEYHSLAPYCGP